MLAPSEYEGGRTSGYLDTATYGLPPGSTIAALERAAAGWRDWEDWHRWEADGETCRALFAGIVGVAASEVAIVSAVSVAAGAVAAGLPAGEGDNVVVTRMTSGRPSTPSSLSSRTRRRGAAAAARRAGGAVDAKTQLVAVSTVQSADGRVAELDELGETGAPLFLDGTQSVGALPLDLEGVDFLAVGAYKWLLCPRGLAFLYVDPPRLGDVEPWHAGWKSAADGGYYGIPRTLARVHGGSTSRCRGCSSRARSRASSSSAALGVEAIAKHDLGARAAVLRRARRFRDRVGDRSGRAEDAEAVAERLAAAGVRCSVRAGALRFAFHLYNDDADVDRALEILRL